MGLTMAQLRTLLDPDEPQYAQMRTLLAPDDIPNLVSIAQGIDPMLASKAAYAVTLIQDQAAVQALGDIAASPHEVVRVASAAGLVNLRGQDVSAVADQLLNDDDAGVRTSAIKAARRLKLPSLEPRLRSMADSDPVPAVRSIAEETLKE
jgi:hypothetical protein